MKAHLTRYATGFGSGAAAALLFLAAMRGAPLAVALAYLGPLPIMIATLGWGLDAGLVALFAACGLAAAGAPGYGIVYGLLIAAPAWALAAFVGAPAYYIRKPEDAAALRPYPGPGAVAVLTAAIFIVAGARAAFVDVVRQGRLRRRGGGVVGPDPQRARRQRRRRAPCPPT